MKIGSMMIIFLAVGILFLIMSGCTSSACKENFILGGPTFDNTTCRSMCYQNFNVTSFKLEYQSGNPICYCDSHNCNPK